MVCRSLVAENEARYETTAYRPRPAGFHPRVREDATPEGPALVAPDRTRVSRGRDVHRRGQPD